MEETSWHSAKVASQKLGVNEQTLKEMREEGALTPGRHWKSHCENSKSNVKIENRRGDN